MTGRRCALRRIWRNARSRPESRSRSRSARMCIRWASLVSPGMLIAAPFRTSRTQGAILIYPRQDGVFTAEEKALVAAIAGFGAVAVAHAELHATAHAQAHELHQLLEISSELSSSSDLEHVSAGLCDSRLGFSWLRALLHRAAEKTGSSRFATESKKASRSAWIRRSPKASPLAPCAPRKCSGPMRPAGLPARISMSSRNIRCTSFSPCRLLGTSGRVLGMFGVLDRLDGTGISQEDIRRARALSNQAAVVLEVARNLHLSEQHRRRAEALIELAREIDGALRLPEFARRFVRRTAELTGSARRITRGVAGRTLAGCGAACTPDNRAQDLCRARASSRSKHHAPAAGRRSARHCGRDFVSQAPFRFHCSIKVWNALCMRHCAILWHSHAETVVSDTAEQVLGSEAASESAAGPIARWCDCLGANGELAGLLCLSGRPSPWIRRIASSWRPWRATPPWRWRMRACSPGSSRPIATGWRFSTPSPTSSWCTTSRIRFCA